MWGIIKKIEEKHKEALSEDYTTTMMRMKEAEMKARMDAAAMMVTPPVYTTTGTPTTSATGTSTSAGAFPTPPATITGFLVEDLIEVADMLRMYDIPQEDLVDLVKTYCKVKNKI